MSTLAPDQLADLTQRINARLAEFGDGMFRQISHGIMRLAYDTIGEWQEEKIVGEWPKTTDPVEGDPLQDGYHIGHIRGYEIGYQHGFAEAERVAMPVRDAPDPEPVEPTPDQAQWQAEYEAAPEPAAVSTDPNGNGNHAPDPDVAREKIAYALANGSGGALALGGAKSRTLAEVDGIENDFDDDGDKDELPTKRVRPNGKRVPHRRAIGYELAQEVKRPAGTHTPDLAALVKEVKRQSMAGVMPTQAAFDVARPATWATAQAHLLRLSLTWASLAEEAGLKLKRPK